MPWLLLSTGMWLWVKESRNPGFHPSPHESTSDVCFSSRASRQLRQGERGPVDRGMIHRREACEDEEVIFGDGGCGDVRFGGGGSAGCLGFQQPLLLMVFTEAPLFY